MLGPMPRYAQLRDFLPEDDHGRLLEWVLANAAEFEAATVAAGRADDEGRVSPRKRVALTTSNLGPFETLLSERLFSALPDIVARTGTPLAPEALELELSAHGDGGFFGAHIDIPTGTKREPQRVAPGPERLLSAVYYFHRQPKAFLGGALRLYRFGADPAGAGLDPANHVDLEPADNSLVAFPSTVLHEVLPVRCPSDAFEDYRFALNCWYCRAL